MKKSKILKIYLILSGLLLTIFGAQTLFNPIGLKASFGIIIPQDVNILNDIRAYSALGLVIGILAIIGAFKEKLTFTANLIVFIQFLALGLGRTLSMILDGALEEMIPGLINEYVFGIVGLILFIIFQKKSNSENKV